MSEDGERVRVALYLEKRARDIRAAGVKFRPVAHYREVLKAKLLEECAREIRDGAHTRAGKEET